MLQPQPVDQKGSDQVFKTFFMDKFEHNFCNKDVSVVTNSSINTKDTERLKRHTCPPGTVPQLQTVLVES